MAHPNGDLAVDDVARVCGLSSRTFLALFSADHRHGAAQWLLRHRVATAKDLTRASAQSLSEIGDACGFADQSHFTRVFTRIAGTSPGVWRRGNGRSR
jgi:AraC family transcriptional regulator